MFAAGVPGRGAELERIGLREADRADDGKGRAELLLRLPREADDDVRRQRDVGSGAANALDQLEILRARVLAVHGRENAIRAGLERQVQVRHQLAYVPVRRDRSSPMSRGWLVVYRRRSSPSIEARCSISRASDQGRPSTP